MIRECGFVKLVAEVIKNSMSPVLYSSGPSRRHSNHYHFRPKNLKVISDIKSPGDPGSSPGPGENFSLKLANREATRR